MGSSKSLRLAGTAWFTVAVAGQMIFAFYVAVLYGRATLSGDLSRWNKVMPHGYVPGDAAGNAAVGMHLLWALVILTAGAIQLVPWIRRERPAIHRWSGRIYMLGAILASVSGIYMVATRGTVGGASQHTSITINGLFILVCAAMAWRYAVRRDFASHRRWALRLFLVSSGVWFFRIGLMLWLVIHRAPVGFDPKTFQGPFLTFLAFGQFLIPLAILELYLRVQQSGGRWSRVAMSGAMGVLTLATAAGVAAAAAGMWLPRL